MHTEFEYVDDRTECGPLRDWSKEHVKLYEWGLEKTSALDELEEWYQRVHIQDVATVPVELRHQEDNPDLFKALAAEWKSETWHLSSIRSTISHPAYLKIIGMGKDALPFIFEDMRKEKSLWFWAL